MFEKLDMKTINFTNENIKKIAEIFPNVVSEDENGKVIDFEALKQELSGNIVEGYKERYSLNWPSKRESQLKANTPTTQTLRPCIEDSVNFDTTENLYIEGDNLEVLKILQEGYLNKIKMIYIDPPYNTGKDFVYKDNFTKNSEEELLESGQIDEDGGKLVANPETNGRYHSDWLSMMYPRLKLARNLLKEDGVIFISIGVEELANLKKLCDEVFGENNFIEIFSWVKTSTPPALSTKSRKTNEYIVCYEKNKNNVKYNGEKLDGGDQPLLNSGNLIRELKFPKDKVYFKEDKFPNGILKQCKPDRVELVQDIEILNGFSTQDFILKGEFKWTQEFLDKEITKGTTFVIKSEILSIRFIRDEEGFKRPTNFIKNVETPLINKKENNVDTNENASSNMNELMKANIFDNPKPISLIKYLTNFIVEKNDLILDFFSGSGTTAHAIMELNSVDSGNRKFIMVQLAEEIDFKNNKIAYDFVKNELKKEPTICEIGKERIRRAGKKIVEKSGNTDLDIGFRVLKLDSSNMKDIYFNPNEISQNILDHTIDNIKEERSDLDLLFGVLIDWGVDLTLPIIKKTIQEKDCYFVDSDSLCAYFGNDINEEFIKELAKKEALRFVFKDSSFGNNDDLKDNVSQIFKQLNPQAEIKVI